MRNISITGMKLETRTALLIGQTVLVRLGRGREVAGTVVWSDGTLAGIRFSAAISVDFVADLAGSEVEIAAN